MVQSIRNCRKTQQILLRPNTPKKMVVSKKVGYYNPLGFASFLKNFGKAILMQFRKQAKKDTDFLPPHLQAEFFSQESQIPRIGRYENIITQRNGAKTKKLGDIEIQALFPVNIVSHLRFFQVPVNFGLCQLQSNTN